MHIDEVVRRGVRGEVRLEGYLVGREGGPVRLCMELLESYPPQCGGPSLAVEGLDPAVLRDLSRAEGVIWSEREVELAGTLEGDVFRVMARAP